MKSKVKSKNEVRTVGRPRMELTYPRGAFTINQLAEANPEVCTLTVRKHVEQGTQSKFLKLLKDTVKSGSVGKPAFKYIRSAVWKGLKSARNKRGGAGTTPTVSPKTVETPVITPSPTPEPIVAEAVPMVIEVPLDQPVVLTEAPVVPTEVVDNELVPA